MGKIKPRTSTEAVSSIVYQVEKRIAQGMCEPCALIAVADLTGIDRDKIDVVYNGATRTEDRYDDRGQV
jgi:hypothetical protein